MDNNQIPPVNLPSEEPAERPRPTPPPIRPRSLSFGASPEENGRDLLRDSIDEAEPAKPISPPPAPEVSVRTLKTDVESVRRGEAMPVPETVMPPEFKKEPEFRPETTSHMGAPVMEEEQAKPKTWVWVAGGVAAAIGLGLLGYFVIFPLIFPSAPSPEAPGAAQEVPASVPAAVHQSFFVTPPAETASANLSTYTLSAISSAFQNEAVKFLANNSLKEVSLLQNGSPVMAGRYLNALVPDISAEAAGRWFKEDFTAYLYYDTNGVWPGYVMRLDPAANISEVDAALAVLETSDLSTFYLVPPGQFQPFKDGRVASYPTRYAVGGQPGAAFNYAIAGDYLVLSASYNGLKAAVQLLGL